MKKYFVSIILESLTHKKVRIVVKKDGMFINKLNKFYKWDEIKIILGNLAWIGSSDIIKIKIIFNDNKEVVFDDSNYNIYNILDDLMPNKLLNYDMDWFSKVTSLKEDDEPVIIYQRKSI